MDLRVRLSKKMLKEALISIMARKPLRDVTITEICEEAQVNRTTFYKYYSSEYTLLKEIEQEFLQKIYDNLENSKNMGSDGKATIAALWNMLKDNIKVANIFIINNIDVDFYDELMKMLDVRLPNNGKYASEIKKFALSGTYKLFCDWLRDNSKITADEVAEFINSMFERLYRR